MGRHATPKLGRGMAPLKEPREARWCSVAARCGERRDVPAAVRPIRRAGHGHRAGSASPMPVQRPGRQYQEVLGARAEFAAREAELEAARLVVARDVADSYARDRAGAWGRTDFLMLLETDATLFNYETAYHRLLTHCAAARRSWWHRMRSRFQVIEGEPVPLFGEWKYGLHRRSTHQHREPSGQFLDLPILILDDLHQRGVRRGSRAFVLFERDVACAKECSNAGR